MQMVFSVGCLTDLSSMAQSRAVLSLKAATGSQIFRPHSAAGRLPQKQPCQNSGSHVSLEGLLQASCITPVLNVCVYTQKHDMQ